MTPFGWTWWKWCAGLVWVWMGSVELRWVWRVLGNMNEEVGFSFIYCDGFDAAKKEGELKNGRHGMGEASLLPISLSPWVALWEFLKPALSLTFHLSPPLTIHSSDIWFWKERISLFVTKHKGPWRREEEKLFSFFSLFLKWLWNFVHKFHNLQTPGKMVAAQKSHVSQFSIQVICQILVTTWWSEQIKMRNAECHFLRFITRNPFVCDNSQQNGTVYHDSKKMPL